MNKYLIVPDVHGRSFWREPVYECLNNSKDTKIIFLGDYLDPYENIKEIAFVTFEEIIDLKNEFPDRIILLIGNHDLHYIYNRQSGCRMDYERRLDIANLFDENKDIFDACYFDVINDKNIIFSHSGFVKGWVENYPNLITTADKEKCDVNFELLRSIDWNKKLFEDKLYCLEDCSPFRGGMSRNSSFMWADVMEMLLTKEHIDAIQIFGHSQQKSDPINYKDFLYCLDCRQCFFINDKAEVTYLDGSKVKENGTSIRDNYIHVFFGY